MTNRNLMLLGWLCAALAAGLFWLRHNSSTRHEEDLVTMTTYSNRLVEVSVKLDEMRSVNTSLDTDLQHQRDAFQNLTNAFTAASTSLTQTEDSLAQTRADFARETTEKDKRIAGLESENNLLDQRAVELNASLTNLNSQIAETQRKLEGTEGDRAFLETELERMRSEKADLLRKFDDLEVLRVQIVKVKQEQELSRRLAWIRSGVFARQDQKGAQQLLEHAAPGAQTASSRYDLNVEINSDDVVKIISATNCSTIVRTQPH